VIATLVKVSLEILDVNDNSPEFPQSSVVRELIESSPVGSALTVDSATDRDTTQFSVTRYALVPADEQAASHFTLKVCHLTVVHSRRGSSSPAP